VLKAWESFASKKKAMGKDSEYHVLQQDLEFSEENTIRINLINKLQEDIINKMRADLMYHIRKSINNGLIDLEIKIKEKQEQRMLYTHREKLEYLQEKKPIIKMLRDRLGLDPEF
jgi:chromosomal replication initiation ATPase DnaA